MDVISILIVVILVLALLMTLCSMYVSRKGKINKNDVDDSFYGQLHRNNKMDFDLLMVETY